MKKFGKKLTKKFLKFIVEHPWDVDDRFELLSREIDHDVFSEFKKFCKKHDVKMDIADKLYDDMLDGQPNVLEEARLAILQQLKQEIEDLEIFWRVEKERNNDQ